DSSIRHLPPVGTERVGRSLYGLIQKENAAPRKANRSTYIIKKRCPAFLQMNTVIQLLGLIPASLFIGCLIFVCGYSTLLIKIKINPSIIFPINLPANIFLLVKSSNWLNESGLCFRSCS